MALTLVQAVARASWRIRLYFAGGDPSTQPLTAFSIARSDGGPNTIRLVNRFSPDAGQLELVTSEPLVVGVSYAVTWSSTTVACVWNVAPDDPTIDLVQEDPEAEVFGVDLDWIYGQPGPDGDCQQRRGQECLPHDLNARALLRKNELVHLPNAGADLDATTNGPASVAELTATAGALDAEFRNDDRVRDLTVTVSPSDDAGGFEYDARVIPVGTGRALRVSNT